MTLNIKYLVNILSLSINDRISEDDQLVIKTEKVIKPNGESFTRKYIQGKLLGRGAFAKVYKFTCAETSEVFAAKVIAKASLRDSVHMQKFKAEIHLHRSLDHPNIVKFHRHFEDSENFYILLELCNNESLSKLIEKRKKITELELQYYLTQVIQALEVIHQQRILHRDLKLANLLLDSHMQLKVADFGLSAKLSSDTEKRKTSCGTPYFMAPEVVNNSKGYSYPVDIWSLGVICYNLLTGKLPFEGPTSKLVYKKIQEGKFSFPANVSVSILAKDIINRLLTLDPEKRITLTQIKNHAFLNPKGGIPQCLPMTLLTEAPSAEFIDQFAAPKELPKLGTLFHKVEGLKETKDYHRNKSTEPTKTPVKKGKQHNTVEKGMSRTSKNKAKNRSVSSGDNALYDTQVTANKESPEKGNNEQQEGGKDNETNNNIQVKEKNMIFETPKTNIKTESDESEKDHGNNLIHVIKGDNIIRSNEGAAIINMYAANLNRRKNFYDNQVGFVHKMRQLYTKEKSIDTKPAVETTKQFVAKPSPFVRIMHWVDYTSGSGLGYTLSNGSVGVLFNDFSKIIADPQGDSFHYITMGFDEIVTKYPMQGYPEALKDKMMSWKRFNMYFEKHGQKISNEIQQEDNNKLLYVMKWFHTKHATLFKMNTEELQIVFIDHSVLRMDPTFKKIKYVDKEGGVESYDLTTESLKKDTDAEKRYNYTIKVLEKIWDKKEEKEYQKMREKPKLTLVTNFFDTKVN